MKPRILILSDNAIRAELVCTLLAGLDAELRTADDAASFHRQTRQACYALVIVLGAAHFLNGSAWLERLRPSALHHPEIYVLSWQHTEQTVLSLMECGVDQYMTFPLNPVRLRAKVIGSLRQ